MKLCYLACLLFLVQTNLVAQEAIEHKIYDTEFGRFDLWVYGNQVTGSYEISPKKIIGSVWMELSELKAVGRWMDPDGTGDIELIFEEGLAKFRADYRGDDEPEKWYRDQWHGTLRSNRSTESPCSEGSYGLIQPFIGTWEEFELNEDGSEGFIGTLNVRLINGGCTLVQRFVNPDSTFSYTTQGQVNPGSGFWEEKYIFSTGSTADYQWIIDQGVIVQRKIGGSRTTNRIYQLRFTELNEQGYLLLQEESYDGGREWAVTGRTRVRRKE